MSTNYYPIDISTIPCEAVGAIAGELLDSLKVTLALFGSDMAVFSYSLQYNETFLDSDWNELSNDQDAALSLIWQDLYSVFYEESGLKLDMIYISSENVGTLTKGWYFIVEGMYQLSEAGKLLRSYVCDETSIQCG